MTTYGDDLAKTMWSKLWNLADVAAMVYDEEQLAKLKKSKIFSEEDEDQRVFHLYPRKSRTSLKKPVTRRRNLLLQWPSSSLFLRDYKIAADFKTKTLKKPPSSSTLHVDYNTDDSEKKEMTKSPQNPNSQSSPSSCLTQSTRSCKRQQRKCSSNGKSKKAKLAPSFSWKGKETPKSLLQLMANMKGEAYNPRLIFERTLYKTDVNPGESRLSMPFNHLIRNDFLTPVELRIIEEDINNDNKIGVGAILVDQMSKKYGVILKRWEMKGSWNYSLTCGWNDVVKANGLKKDDYISVWSFRWRGILSFALVPAPSPTMEQSSSTIPL